MLPALARTTTTTNEAPAHRRFQSGTVAHSTDRRASRRLPIEIDVTVEGAAHRFTAPTADLSTGGLFVLTVSPIPIATHVLLAFTLPNGAELEVIGVVQWTRTGYGDGTEGQPGLGIAFFCLEPEARAVLERFCSVREALY